VSAVRGLNEPWVTERQALGVLATVAVIAGLAVSRRTRPLAGFLYGLALSRAHGAAQNHLETKVLRLFDQRASVHVRVAHLAGLVGRLTERVTDLELIIAHAGPNGRALLDATVSEAHQRVRDRVPDFEGLRGRAA
jgi:hypothetical protein